MRNTVLLTFVFLVSTFCLQAQSAKASQDTGKSSGKTSNLTTLTGCLQLSNTRYMLTEDNGTEHELSGAANKLSHHVGHEIEVTGKQAIMTVDTTAPGAASSTVEKWVFEVKSVKHVADTCQ